MILVDTNVLARSLQVGDPQQSPALQAMASLSSEPDGLVVFPQILLEFYAISTRTSQGLGLTPDAAIQQIQVIKSQFPLLPESPAIFPAWELLITKYKLTNRRVYDLRLVAQMSISGITKVLTFNDADFKDITEIQALNPFDVLSLPRL